MATNPMDIQKRINDMHNLQRNSGVAELRASQQKAVGGINQQKKQTGQQFYDQRNQADVGYNQNRQGLKEMMAAQGLGNSGENISAQVGLQSARQNTLGGLQRDEQNILGGLDSKIAEINDPSRENSLIAQIEASRNRELADAMQRAMEQAEQQRQFNEQLAWQKEQFRVQQANRRSSGGGGSTSSRSSQSKTNIKSLYDEYQKEKATPPKTTLDRYYTKMQEIYQEPNRYLQPPSPNDNPAFSPYDKLRILRGR